MFDIGFWEVLILATLGLLILGPERLPRVVSKIGRWVGAARRTANQLRWQIERELELTERADRSNRNRKDGKPKNVIYPVHSSRGDDGASAGTGTDAEGGGKTGADDGGDGGGERSGPAEADPGPRLGNAMGATHDSSGVAQDPPPAASGGAAGTRDGTGRGSAAAGTQRPADAPGGNTGESAAADRAGNDDPDARQS